MVKVDGRGFTECFYLCLGCYTKTIDCVVWTKETILIVLEFEKPKMKMPADPVLVTALFLACRWLSSNCVLIWWRSLLCLWATNSTGLVTRMTSLHHNYLPNSPISNYSHVRVSASHFFLWIEEGSTIQSITLYPWLSKMHVLLTCKIHSFHPDSSKILNTSTLKFKVQSLIWISSKSNMRATPGRIHSKAKFYLAVNLWNQENYASNLQEWGRHRIDIPVSEREI